MEKGNYLNKLLSGVLLGGMLLSFGGVALAAEANNSSAKNLAGNRKCIVMKNKPNFVADKKQVLTSALDQLVKEGTITKTKAEQIKIYVDKKIKEKEVRHEEYKKLSPEQRKALHEKGRAEKNKNDKKVKTGLFGEMVKDNVISQKQADALKSKVKEIASTRYQQRITNGLKSLVENKTINQEQADKIAKQLQDARKNHKAIFEKIKGMTPEQRQQYFKKNKTEFKNPLERLIQDGTITKAQADSIGKAIFNQKG